jgi:hypothetical protein
MQSVFTKDDILRFIYNEVDNEERQAIEHAINTEPVMRRRYNRMMNVVQELNSFSVNPNPSSIDLIMEYSRDAHTLQASR